MAGITSTKKIKGQKHFLAYITPSEAEILEKSGGKKTMTKEGVPAYPPSNDARGESRGRGPEAGNSGRERGAEENRNPSTPSKNTSPKNNTPDRNKETKDNRQTYNVDKKNVRTGPKKTDTKTVTGKDTGKGSSYEKAEKKFKEAVDDYTKAQKISGYKPLNLNYLPVIGPTRKIFGTPFTVKGKTNMAKRRMEYINSLPPAQRKAMIERLGYAVDEEYDELDEQALSKAGLGVFNPEDVNTNFKAYGNTDDPNFKTLQLTDDPLSYVGENPIYGPDAMDIINYDGEYLKKYGPDLGGGSGGDDPIIYTGTGTTDDTTDDEVTYDYRFGDPNANTALDVTLGRYFNQGGRVPRAFGGIMDSATGRKAYGLGSIFKSIKKTVGKVLKSDLGKAAIAGAMFYYGGGGRMPFTQAFNATKGGGFGGAKLFGEGSFFSKSNPLLFSDGKFNPFKASGLITLGAAAMGPAKQDPSLLASRKDTGLIDPLTGKEGTQASMRENIELAKLEAAGDPDKLAALNQAYNNMLFTTKPYENYGIYAANGGRIGFAFGGQPLPHDPTKPVNPWTPKPQGPVLPNKAGGYGKQRVMAEEGGLMNLGGMEKDYRAEGGFVPIGKEEKADDVPARLSVNEFVFTADAVRNAGGGDIDKGAEVMENMMKNLEKGGRISEESQGNIGAQQMFETSERLGEVI